MKNTDLKNQDVAHFLNGLHDPIDPGMYKKNIEKKAYELYERNGCQEGHALENWLEAESLYKDMGIAV